MTLAQASGDATANGWRPIQFNEALAPGQEVAAGADGRQYVRSSPRASPAPNAAGAQASRPSEALLTPQQVQAYRSTAEGQKLLEPQQPGVQNLNAYVPGVNPNRAEREQSVNTARELKASNLADPAVSEENKAIAAAHNEARGNFFASIAGSDVDVANAKAARTAQAESDLAAAWSNKTEANAQPLLDLADHITASPDGRRPVVRGALDKITAELHDADGNLYTDPEQLCGVRKHMDGLMSKEAGADDPKSVRAMAAMGQMEDALDQVIEPAAPGFRQYLDNFSAAPGINPYKSLTEIWQRGIPAGQSTASVNGGLRSVVRLLHPFRQGSL